jgi:hypothetical protein
MDDTTLLIIAIVAVIVIAIAVAVMLAMKAKRRKELQSRFGPEYDRTVDGAGSTRKAERDLQERAQQRDELDIRDLTPAQCERYREQWQGLQASFVDRPSSALADADDLVRSVMRDRGYPVDDFEQQAGLISVDHPQIVQHYRSAHDIYERNLVDEVSTEDQRKAVVHYRALFDELMTSSSDDGSDRDVDRDRDRDRDRDVERTSIEDRSSSR